MMKATVRVGSGSGVVIRNGANTLIATAAHVVKGDGPHLIKWPGGFDEQGVLARDDKADVAVLAAPPKLEAFALDVDDIEAEVGDSVTAAGFPDGWNELHPVLARGVIAGYGEENWVNLDGTWGHSGGPLCLIVSGARPLVVGILLGRAGAVNRQLEHLRKYFTRQHEAALEHPVIMHVVGWVDTALQTIDGVTGFLKEMTSLMDDHFRTGFLRFASATDVLKLLGERADRPAT
jgi:hypothetical protein